MQLQRAMRGIGAAVALLIFAFLWGVWPTLYWYKGLESDYTIRVNRLTGNAQLLTLQGWASMEAPNAVPETEHASAQSQNRTLTDEQLTSNRFR